jgi:hypothetical protein
MKSGNKRRAPEGIIKLLSAGYKVTLVRAKLRIETKSYRGKVLPRWFQSLGWNIIANRTVVLCFVKVNDIFLGAVAVVAVVKVVDLLSY